ncbi:MAG: NADH-quinone oxidoreductase subunit L [Actinomycetota bacterium]|nr:NADH-quinone oxidoreductase subunit L [Actinomycetota bacterium]
MSTVAWLIPTLPAVAAVVGLLVGRRLPGGPALLAVGTTAATTVLSIVLAAQVLPHPSRTVGASTLLTPTGGVRIAVGAGVDGLAALVAVMVCVVALLVQVYSTAYLRGDARYSSYAALVSLFTAAMLLVVVSVDLLELLVGWEVMGVCSYFLIGHYREQPAAGAAAIKAFLTTRVGDVGFLFGIFTLGMAAHSFAIGDVLAARYSHTTVTVGTLLLVCGVVGKSAQFPLHTWLPDAMAGPTPISALIHAATMVAAGVYVVARLYPVFLQAPATLDVLGVIAAITMVLGALVALVTDDLKKVLAWSTVSQLAYMTGALAVGGYAAGVFHLLTHAGFKALLFLGAGSVLTAVGTNLMSEMGGLRRALPVTFATTTVGLAALIGLPPFSGFFSKDTVLAAALHSVSARDVNDVDVSRWVAELVLAAGLVTVLLTAAYATRLWLRTFFGRQRRAADPHESPLAMTAPLVLLATVTLLLGSIGASARHGLASWVGSGRQGPRFAWFAYAPLGTVIRARGSGLGLDAPLAAGTTLLALVGILGVVLVWRRAPDADPVRVLGRLAVPLRRGFYLDDLYALVFVRPVRGVLARAAVAVDDGVLDRTVNASGSATRLLGSGLRRLQSGNVQAYATGMFIGILLLAAGVLAVAR